MKFTIAHFDFEGVPVSCRIGGAGFPVLMLHGSGPGASTQGNWSKVLEPLATRFHIHAMDLIGFGQSGRKAMAPYFDFELWLRQCRAMISRMPGGRIGIVGHSLSGALALKLATLEPRVAKVLTTATMGGRFPLNDATARVWTFPRDRADLVLTARTLIHDHALIDEAYLANREAVLSADDYAAYFTAMFGEDKQSYIDAAVLSDAELARVACDVTMMHGRDDTGFPAGPLTLALADKLPQADVHLIARCSHSVAMEHPGKLIAAATQLFHT